MTYILRFTHIYVYGFVSVYLSVVGDVILRFTYISVYGFVSVYLSVVGDVILQ